MRYIINTLSFESYIFVLAALFFGSIFGIYDMRKKKPGHPMTWVLPFSMELCIALALNRCALELTTNHLFQQITDIIAIVSVICFFLSFVITFILAYKKDYVDKEKFKKIMPLLIGCIIIMAICFGSLVLI